MNEAAWKEGQPTDADRERGSKILAWGQALAERGELSDYLHNVSLACRLDYVLPRSTGVLASACAAHAKELEIELERRKRVNKGEGEHAGTIGKRQVFTRLTVLRTRFTESQWGCTTIVALEDEHGNELTWFASGVKGYEPGDMLTGKGTVKAHGEYQGRKTTTLTRCDLTSVEIEKKAG